LDEIRKNTNPTYDASNQLFPLPNGYGSTQSCETLFSDAIHESLSDLLGGRATEAIYDFMKRKYSVDRSELPKHLDELSTLFEQTFGVAAKNVITEACAKRVYAKLDLGFRPISNFEFADYLALIRTRMRKEGMDRAEKTRRAQDTAPTRM